MTSVPVADLDHILAHTGDIWRKLAGARLFITGGTGFFGIWLLETIVAANERLKASVGASVLSRDPAAFLARMPHLASRKEFDWLAGHPASFRFPQLRHDYVLHLATATSAHDGRTDPIEMLQTKLDSIRHVLDYARYAGISRMLVTSSGAVYGPQPAELSHVPETYAGAPDPTQAASAYGQGKRLVEQICSATPGVECVFARCFSFVGPHLPLDARFAVGNFLRNALTGGPVTVGGDGTPLRSYLYTGDLIPWLLNLLVNGQARRAYNVGSDQAVSIAELAHAVAATAGGCGVVVTKAPGDGPVQRYVPSIARARQELGLDVWTPLPDALSRTLDWARRHAAG